MYDIYIYIHVISSQIMVLPYKFPEFVFLQVENVGSQQVPGEFLVSSLGVAHLKTSGVSCHLDPFGKIQLT